MEKSKERQMCAGKMQRCETQCFQCFVTPVTRKGSSLKRRGRRDQLQRGQQKLLPVVARSRFPSQKLLSPATFEVEKSKSCSWSWRGCDFDTKSDKLTHARAMFQRPKLVSRDRRKEFCTSAKVISENPGFGTLFKNLGRRGTFEAWLQ